MAGARAFSMSACCSPWNATVAASSQVSRSRVTRSSRFPCSATSVPLREQVRRTRPPRKPSPPEEVRCERFHSRLSSLFCWFSRPSDGRAPRGIRCAVHDDRHRFRGYVSEGMIKRPHRHRGKWAVARTIDWVGHAVAGMAGGAGAGWSRSFTSQSSLPQ